MRPNNQNKRSRGRASGNRNRQGGGNPLTRNYESNGPDVKVRGNAAHIVEKYVQLARDAQNASDSVAEQNYLQHAEHYLRIVSAATAQNQLRQEKQMAENQERQKLENITKSSAVSVEQNISENSSSDGQPAKEPAKDEVKKEENKQAQKPKLRRPRRQPRVQENKPAKDVEDAKLPQAEADGLPAFLTAGAKPDAAE